MDYVEARNNETQKPSGGMHLAQALWSLNSPGVESPGRQEYPASHSGLLVDGAGLEMLPGAVLDRRLN